MVEFDATLITIAWIIVALFILLASYYFYVMLDYYDSGRQLHYKLMEKLDED